MLHPWRPGLRALGLSVFLLLGAACATDPGPAGPASGPRFVLHLVPGPEYRGLTWWGPFPLAVYPQVAVWVEGPDGRFVSTLYATAKGARGGWVSAPEGGRPEALPIWSHRRDASGPVDAVARATPAGVTDEALGAGSLAPGVYRLLLEVNRSYDFNPAYPASAGVSGQPSVLYEALVTVGSGAQTVEFRPVGRGSVDGSSGRVDPGLGDLTTALDLFRSLEVDFRPD